jgi:hypothetical protein
METLWPEELLASREREDDEVADDADADASDELDSEHRSSLAALINASMASRCSGSREDMVLGDVVARSREPTGTNACLNESNDGSK